MTGKLLSIPLYFLNMKKILHPCSYIKKDNIPTSKDIAIIGISINLLYQNQFHQLMDGVQYACEDVASGQTCSLRQGLNNCQE